MPALLARVAIRASASLMSRLAIPWRWNAAENEQIVDERDVLSKKDGVVRLPPNRDIARQFAADERQKSCTPAFLVVGEVELRAFWIAGIHLRVEHLDDPIQVFGPYNLDFEVQH